MKIQQHDGVVVDAGRHRSRASPFSTEEKEVLEGRGRRQGHGCGCPPSPPLYIGSPGGRQPWRSNLPRGRRPRGWSAPQVGRPPP